MLFIVYTLLKFRESLSLQTKMSKESLHDGKQIFPFKDWGILRCVILYISLLCPSEPKKYFIVSIWRFKVCGIYLFSYEL